MSLATYDTEQLVQMVSVLRVSLDGRAIPKLEEMAQRWDELADNEIVLPWYRSLARASASSCRKTLENIQKDRDAAKEQV